MNCYHIKQRQNAVNAFCGDIITRDKIMSLMSGVSDIERLMTRIVYSGANARELRQICSTAEVIPKIKAELAGQVRAYLVERKAADESRGVKW
jgi:DNA mismatch repair protein MutS